MSNAKTIERFNAKTIESESGCIEWMGYRDKKMGYGMFWLDGSMRLAHRVSYVLSFGKIKDGMHVCHSCDNPSCVNPDHLWLGTNIDNVKDKCLKGRAAGLPGEKHPGAKLNEEKVSFIRVSPLSGAAIARMFGVDKSTVNYIRKRKLWSHV